MEKQIIIFLIWYSAKISSLHSHWLEWRSHMEEFAPCHEHVNNNFSIISILNKYEWGGHLKDEKRTRIRKIRNKKEKGKMKDVEKQKKWKRANKKSMKATVLHDFHACSQNYSKIWLPPCDFCLKGLYLKPLNNEHYFIFALYPYGFEHLVSLKLDWNVMLQTYFFMCAIWIHREKTSSLKLELAVYTCIFQGYISIRLHNLQGFVIAVQQKSPWNFICVLWVLVSETSFQENIHNIEVKYLWVSINSWKFFKCDNNNPKPGLLCRS